MLAQRLYLRNPSVTHSECLIFTNNHTIRDTAQVPLNHACSLCGGSDHCLLGVPRQNALRWLLSHTLPQGVLLQGLPRSKAASSQRSPLLQWIHGSTSPQAKPVLLDAGPANPTACLSKATLASHPGKPKLRHTHFQPHFQKLVPKLLP